MGKHSSGDSMSQGSYGQARPSTSGAAIAGLVLGVVALISSWVPFINNFSFIIGAIGLILAIVGVVGTVRGRRAGKGLAIAALVINLVACAVVLATQSAMSAAIDDATSSPEVSSVGASSEPAATDDAPDSAETQQATTDLAPGTSIELENGLVVSVDSVEPGLTNFDGSSVVGVRVTYVNNGTEQASYNSYDWKGEDANGAQEYTTYYSDATDDLGSGTLAAGGTKSGTIYFEGTAVKALYFGNILSDAPSASWTIG